MRIPSDQALELLDFMVEAGATVRSGAPTSEQLMTALDIRRIETVDRLLNELIEALFVIKRLPSTIVGRPTYQVDFRNYQRLLKDLEQGVTPDSDRVVLGDSAAAEVIPASDRTVSLDHNSPQYAEIAEGIEQVYEAARSVNDFVGRDRILRSLEAAQALWQATELKIVQVKIGLILVIEDAAKALAETAKAIATSLLVDAIKALVKAKTGIDLDNF